MDLDPCGNDNFYDGIASFIPHDSLDGIDEILRFTDTQLDSAIDLKTFVPLPVHDFDVPMFESPLLEQTRLPEQPAQLDGFGGNNDNDDDLKFNFWTYPSPATTTTSSQSAFTSPYDSQRTSSTSTSSVDGDHFNPDEFMNFLNDDDCKMGELTRDNVADMPRRNTPSPTGSCTSSSGSSTSGVQSDASSSAYTDTGYGELKPSSVDQVENGLVEEPREFASAATTHTTLVAPAAVAPIISLPITILEPLPAISVMPPVMPLAVPAAGTPLADMHAAAAAPAVAPATIRVEPKLAAKANLPAVKVVAPTAGAPQTATKVSAPTNSKPKTIFLSSNDFKALMQKMNSSGKSNNKLHGQMPKIIMKTANGKVVTANKPTILNVGNSGSSNATAPAVTTTAAAATAATNVGPPTGAAAAAPTTTSHFVPKFLKGSNGGGPLQVTTKQQHQHHQPTKVHSNNNSNSNTTTTTTTTAAAPGSGAVVAAARTTLGHHNRSGGGRDLSIYKGLIDEKMLKKQQRMIKNRESASLSRKKKKEYVVSLETRINNLEKENYTLKGENTSLRSQLVAFAQTCQCKHSNVSEFVLNSLNVKVNNGVCGSEHHHVKIAPKPAGGKSFKQRMTAATVRKNVAVLFAMAFMVTLNVGSFQTYFNQNAIENAVEQTEEAAQPLNSAAAAGRRLLWVETEAEFNENSNHSKRDQSELEVPPLHFLRPANRTNALAAAEQHGNMTEPPLPSKCDGLLGANQTEENMRLARKLHKWIDGNDHLNLSLHEKFGDDLENPGGFKLTHDYLELKTLELPLQAGTAQKRKYYIQRADYNDKKPRKFDTDNDNDNGNGNGNGNGNFNGNRNGNLDGKHSLDLFKPKINEEYLRLFKGIKRQDDTFYVLSFNMDHILLPASAHNKSSRPKMSLMLPAGDPSINGDIKLMQIDCEVVNTTELELKSHMIPEKLRPGKYGNVHVQPNDVANNETRDSHNKQSRDKMHMNASSSRSSSSSSSSSSTTTTTTTGAAAATEHFKKPPIRTYFMMGPKAQAALKNRTKPRIVKLSTNDDEDVFAAVKPALQNHGSAVHVKNSTLYTRMRETIEADSLLP